VGASGIIGAVKTPRTLVAALLLGTSCARLHSVDPDAATPDVQGQDAATPAAIDATPVPDTTDAAPAPDNSPRCAEWGQRRCVSARTRLTCSLTGVATLDDCPDRPSGTGRCDQGVCTVTCAPGAYNCDDDPSNGCESASPCPSVMLSGFGGSTGYGPDSQCLHPSDNGAYAGPGAHDGDPPVPIDLTTTFPEGISFFGVRPRAMFVNINGSISFNQPITTGTPRALPVAGQPMLAPFWADVDTRGGGQPARNNVCFVLQPHRLVVTWDRVGRHDRHDDRLNSFQLVARTGEGCMSTQLIVEFRYARCEWTVGDASGDTHALAGVDAGNRMNFVALPMSRTPAIADLCRLTNVVGGPPGLFRFQLYTSCGQI